MSRRHRVCRLLSVLVFRFLLLFFFFFQAEDGIRDLTVTGVQTCALPISKSDGKAQRFRYRPLEGGKPLATTADGKCFCAAYDRGKGRLIVFSVSRGLGKIGRASCRERV